MQKKKNLRIPKVHGLFYLPLLPFSQKTFGWRDLSRVFRAVGNFDVSPERTSQNFGSCQFIPVIFN